MTGDEDEVKGRIWRRITDGLADGNHRIQEMMDDPEVKQELEEYKRRLDAATARIVGIEDSVEPLMTTAGKVWPTQTLINVPGGGGGHWRIVTTQRHAASGPGASLGENEIRLTMHDKGTGQDLSITVARDTELQLERWADRRR